MKKKILFTLCIAFIAVLAFAPVISATNNTSVTAYAEETDWPEFDLVAGENSTEIKVTPADERQSSIWNTVYIILLPAGAVVTVGVAILLFVVFKKKGQKLNTVRIVAQILTVAFSFTVLCGTGIFGIVGLLEEKYESIYYFAGSTDSENPAPDPIKGFTEDIVNRKILSTFDHGLEMKYDRVYSNFPHFWNTSSPKHNYSTMSLGAKNSHRYEYAFESVDDDGANVWYVLPAEDSYDVGEDFYADAEYRLTMNSSDGETNYVNTVIYDKMRLVFKAENTGNPVNLTVIADTRRKEANSEGDFAPIRYELGTYTGNSGEKVEITLNMGVIAEEDRPYLSRVIFRTTNENVGSGNESAFQKNSIFYLELYSTQKTTGSAELIGTDVNTVKLDDNKRAPVILDMESEFLGSLGYGLLGSYSASGFYDTTDKKWKLWYGAGIPENIASDNVYYTETTDINKGWTKPVRLILNDPTGKLCAANVAPGYGGDPGVIKVDGVYYMYFSGLENTPKPPNKIYLATSTDGINFTVYGAVVDVEKMGLGYGAGSPSVIYKDGIWYLYYYTQSPSKQYPNEPTGFVLKTGTTPYEFGEAVATQNTYGAADVKWMPTLNMWVCTDYTEGVGQGGYNFDSVRIGFSKDGLYFNFTNEPLSRPVQDYTVKTNHNPGFIGNELGYGYETMFLTYGVNDFSLRTMDAGLQMDTRMLGYSRVTFSQRIGDEL